MRKWISILMLFMAFSLLASCGKTADIPDTTPMEESEASPETDGTAAPILREPKYYMGEISRCDVFEKMCTLVKYINKPVNTRDELEQLDLLYFAFESSLDDPRTVYPGGGVLETGYEASVASEVLSEHLCAVFGIERDYLDRFKEGGYKFLSEYDSYDAETDRFLYRASDAGWLYGDYCRISYYDTRIHIDAPYITVKTVITSPDGETWSADYKLEAVKLGAPLCYRLVSLTVYEDARNKNTLIITLDGMDFYAPWFICEESEDNTAIEAGGGYESWTLPYQVLSTPPGPLPKEKYSDYNGDTGICKYAIYDGVAYLTFVYYGVADTYVYDIEAGTGYWMSGAENLDEFYRAELDTISELNAKAEIEGGQLSWYRSFDVVTIARAHNCALLRRSLKPGEVEGEYIMRDLETGEETYICGSYTRKSMIISYMDETFEWVDDDHLRIGTVADMDGGWMIVYDVVFDGKGWVASKSEGGD